MSTTTTKVPALIHKTLGGFGVKVLDDEEGIVEAYVSGIGNKDSVGDIIMSGAYTDSLAMRTPKGVWSHDWSRPVSKTLEIREVAAGDPALPLKMKSAGIGGLYVRTQFNLETQDGRDAFSNVKFFGEESEWSIGYQIAESSYDKDKKALLLHKVDLFEYSPVLFGANSLTATVAVKVALPDGEEITVKVEGADPSMTEQITEAVQASLRTAPAAQKTDSLEETPMSAPSAPPSLKDLIQGAIDFHEAEGTSDAEKALLKALVENLVAPAEEEGGTKVIPGSYEQRWSQVDDALSEMAGRDAYAYSIATFDTSVVFYVYDYESGDSGYFQATYSISDGEVTLGTPDAVDVVEVVVAKHALGSMAIKDVKIVLDDLGVKSNEIEVKAGRVLSKGNRSKIEDAIAALEDVINADSKEEEASDEGTASEKDAEGAADTDAKVAMSEKDAEGAADTDAKVEKTYDADEVAALLKDLGIEDAPIVAEAKDFDGFPEIAEDVEVSVLSWTDATDSGLVTLSFSDETPDHEVSYVLSEGSVAIEKVAEIGVEEKDSDAPVTVDADFLSEFKSLQAEIEAINIDA